MKTSGGRLVLSTPVQFSSYLASEIQNYRKQLRAAGHQDGLTFLIALCRLRDGVPSRFQAR
ncbi:hypothetical protein ACU4GD_04685 [Cupriavidus basilensis]